MAAIDKTYVNKEELFEAIEWCKKIGEVTMENGYKFKPINFIYGYNDLDDPHYFDKERVEYVLWNTPMWYDRWLWMNCPLSFVRDRLMIQYGEDGLKDFENYKFDNKKNKIEIGHQHYTFLKTPKWHGHKWLMKHGRKDNPWPDKKGMQTYFIKIVSPTKRYDDDLSYDTQSDAWYSYNDLQPTYPSGSSDYVWQLYHKNPPSKKSILRQLRKWYIPKGYIVKVYQLKYVGMDFEILVK